MATATTTATPTITTASTSAATSEAGSSHGVLYNDVVAIGAGLSGIALVARLKMVHNFTDVHLYERNSSSGGTWWVNSYPGKTRSPHTSGRLNG